MGVRPHLASLVEEFRRHAAETAVVEHRGNRRYRVSYGDLARMAGRFAAELERRGITVGDRVALLGENSAAWIGVFFGCLLRGVIAVPLDAAGSNEFAERIVLDVSPKLIAGDASLLQQLAVSVPKVPFADLDRQLPPQPLLTVSDAVSAETQFQIVFTSGTTSEPRGIVHTHRNVLASLQPIEDEIRKYRRYERWVHPLRFLETLPLSHVFGQFMGLWIPVLLGAEVHFSGQLVASHVVELIYDEHISVLIAVPRVVELLRLHLLGRIDSLTGQMEHASDLAIWKRWWRFRRVHRTLGWKFWAIVSGGATLAPDLEKFWSGLGFALIQGYGMTETAALVTLNHPFRIGQGTIGRTLPGREVRISDDGEILVRGDMLAQATWSGGAMRQRPGEWFATGDLAAQEESGELRFLGRKSDVIVTRAGMNIHPGDLEEAMMKQSGVRGCAVVACELQGGPDPVAVVLASGNDDDLNAAVVQANRSLAGYQQIRRVLRWPELQFPYTSTGKLLRKQIAEWACASLAKPRETAEGGNDVVARTIAEVTGEIVADGNDNQRLSEDLHLDSLGRVQLQSVIEQRLGAELDDAEIAAAETLGDLRSMIERGSVDSSFEAEADTHREPAGAAKHTQATATFRYPKWPWSWPVHVMRVVFLEFVARPLIWLLAAPVVKYDAALPGGPVLVIANHVSAYDGAFVLYALPGRLRRRMAVAMSGELLRDMRCGRNQGSMFLNLLAPVGYWLATALFNVFPLPRVSGFRRSFAHTGDAMDRGYSVLIFPEGARSADGKLQPFRAGTGLLAQESRVPVVPVEMIGLGEMQASGRWFRSGELTLRVGAAIPMDEAATPAELTARLEQCFEHLR